MRPLSVVSDFEEAIMNACDSAFSAGLEFDQITDIALESLKKWQKIFEAEVEGGAEE